LNAEFFCWVTSFSKCDLETMVWDFAMLS